MTLSLFAVFLVVSSTALNIAIFVCLQAVVIRTYRPRRLLWTSVLLFVLTTMLCVLFVSALSWGIFESWHAVLGFGVIVMYGSCGLCGLYTFLGPATADRSATAHMLVYLRERGGSASSKEIIGDFDGPDFVRKRFGECLQANIITLDGEDVVLTSRGTRLGRIFQLARVLMKLDDLPGYRRSFKPSWKAQNREADCC
jgi:hypothetical protein